MGVGLVQAETERTSAAQRAAEVAAALEEDIALGHLRPRERLLEDELVRRFDAKRHVIRQALSALTEMNIVVHVPNKGAAVRDFSPEEVEHLYEVRELLERRAAELIPLPAPAALITRLLQIHGRHIAAVRAGDLRTVFRQNLLFHSTLFAACGNPVLLGAVEHYAMRTHGIRSYTISDAALLHGVCEEHASMIDCLKRRDRPALVKLVSAHLQPAKTSYLARAKALSPVAAPVPPRQGGGRQ